MSKNVACTPAMFGMHLIFCKNAWQSLRLDIFVPLASSFHSEPGARMAALNAVRSLGCFLMNWGQNLNLALVRTAGTCPALKFPLRLATTGLSLSTVGRPYAIALNQERRASASRTCVYNSPEEPTSGLTPCDAAGLLAWA